MPRVAYIDVPPELAGFYPKQFAPLYKTVNSSVRWNGRLIPPRKKYKYTTKSLLPQIRDLWNGLTLTEQQAWRDAGHMQSYGAWNTFVQDTAYRLKYGIPGLADPSTLRTYKCGEILMPVDGPSFKLVQEHPIEYFKMRKVRGTKSQYEPVAIDEQLVLPLTVGLTFRTNLTATDANPIVRFYAEVHYSYQGTTPTTQVGFDIPLVSGWQRQTATLNGVVGHARWYTLVFELSGVSGTLQFDLVQSEHSGTNYARDFRCSSIGTGFTNTNYQLPKAWAAKEAVAGVEYGSVYPSDGDL